MVIKLFQLLGLLIGFVYILFLHSFKFLLSAVISAWLFLLCSLVSVLPIVFILANSFLKALISAVDFIDYSRYYYFCIFPYSKIWFLTWWILSISSPMIQIFLTSSLFKFSMFEYAEAEYLFYSVSSYNSLVSLNLD